MYCAKSDLVWHKVIIRVLNRAGTYVQYKKLVKNVNHYIVVGFTRNMYYYCYVLIKSHGKLMLSCTTTHTCIFLCVCACVSKCVCVCFSASE